ncbi:MAG: hypothetical protein IH630_04285 [Thermoplasmata archaeon]|nr:hypothetical protein [Thermoplasmata archaeon]TFG68388.1 MAG: hypothetical protein E4H25_06040 [Methanomassiliicoccus sp.]
MLTEIQKVVDDSTRKLLQISTPPVRYWLLYDVMKKDASDPILKQTIRECATYQPRLRLLNSLRRDGTWPISKLRREEEDRGPGQPIGWTYTTMLRNQLILGDYATGIDEGNMRACFEKMLSWQVKDGYIPGPSTAAFPVPHYNGFALRNLIEFGLRNDPRTAKLLKWLFGMQRHDGGWNIPYLQDVRYRPEYTHMRIKDFMKLVESENRPTYDPDEYGHIPSCLWSTLAAIRGSSWDPRLTTRKEVRRGADFLLDGFFKRNYHATFLQSEKNWTTLKYPMYLGSGLAALEILATIGYGPEDERMEKGVRWLLKMRSEDGFWYRSDRPDPEKNQWITEIAISTLSRYADMY